MRRKSNRKTLLAFLRRKSIAVFMALLMVIPYTSFGVPSAPVTAGIVNRPGAVKTSRVDVASGNLAFVENIFSLKGYKLTLKYNTEGIVKEVKTINGDKPTGVVGLGWKLSKDRIVRLTHQTANTVDDEYLLNAHGKISKLTFEYESGDTIHFRLHSNPYWKILFLEGRNQWKIQKETGKEYIYGDGNLIDHVAHSTEKGISWGNWIGSSVVPTNQRQFSVAWNLSAIDNIFGERVKLYYEQDLERVGGAPNSPQFTKASYLKKVVGMDGNYIELSYGNKDANEYEDPHIENTVASEHNDFSVTQPSTIIGTGDRDAFQERFETKYLNTVVRKSFANVIDRKAQLNYTFLGANKLTKRLLSEIQYLNGAGGKFQPSKMFKYYSTSDNVTVNEVDAGTRVFNSSNGALYGAMKSITIPGGGTYIYKYDEKTIGHSNRSFDIPFPRDTTYTDEERHRVTVGWLAPKLFFMSDYVVVLHELNAHDLKVTNIGICTWIGDRWVHQDFGHFAGAFYDRYHAEDYHEKNIIATIKNALMSGLSSQIPALGGLMNAFNDAVTDDMNNLYEEISDLASGDVGGAIRQFFVGNYTIIRDVVEDMFAAVRQEFENADELITGMFGIHSRQNSERDLAELEEAYAAQNPRKVYHISMQKDFFAITSSHGLNNSGTFNQALRIFEKDPLIEGKWAVSALPVMISSKYFDVQTGNQFVTVFDECMDVIYTFTKHRFKRWPSNFFRINQVLTDRESTNMSRITAQAANGIQNGFGQLPEADKDYLNLLSQDKRSAITARNNFILVATSQADGANGRVQMFHHDKNRDWNWTTPAEVRFNKTLIPSDVPNSLGPMAQGLAGNSLLQLKSGNSIASLQVYDNMNTEAYNDVLQVITGGVGSTDGSSNPINPLSTIQNDLVQDLSAMNATYGIVWNEDMSRISVQLLHVGVAQTGIKTYVNGNVIQKIGKAYSAIIGAQEYDDNGINYAFRYNGQKWITQSFPSDYFSSAMAPDVATQMREASNRAYKTPKFQQYNANRPVASVTTHTQHGSIRTNSDGDLQGFVPAEIASNIPSQNLWSEISNASQEQINAPEFVKEAIHLASDILNLVIQVIMMVIPFAQELAIAEEVISIIDKIVQVAGLAAMIIQPAADALVDKILGVNHKSTSIANNYLSTNGKLFARTPDGSWTSLGRAFQLGTDDKLVGINNSLSNGYYNYTVRRHSAFNDAANGGRSTNIQNYVTLLKNRKIYKTIPFNQYKNGNLLVVRKDSLVMTGGNNTFVSYGPANNDGYVRRNTAITRTDAQNAEQRRRKMSYEDATIVRLHRIADDAVSGQLKDYVVKSVETSTGYESTYVFYNYVTSTATYSDSHGSAIYPRVDAIPTNSANYNYDSYPFGISRYYFYNSKNFYRPGSAASSEGFPGMARVVTNLPLVTYHSFDHRDTTDFEDRGIKTLYGRQYMMDVMDSNNRIMSRQIDCHKIFAHDFFHRGSILELDHVYQPLSSVKLKMLDGVETKTVNRYTDEFRATLLRTIEHHTTSVSGDPEVHYQTKRYAFEHYPELLDQNRLHEVSLVVDSVRKGGRTYVLDATATAYTDAHNDGLWLPYKTYKANLATDILDSSVENYQAVAAADMALQDRDFALYSALMTAYEVEIGNFKEAYEFVVSASDASLNSFDQVKVTHSELVNARYQIDRTTADLHESEAEIAQAQSELDGVKGAYDTALRDYNRAKDAVQDKKDDWHEAQRKRDIIVAVAFATGGPLPGGIAYAVEKKKVHAAYEAYQEAIKDEKDAKDILDSAYERVRSARDVLASLNAQHDAVVRAINLSKIEIHNAIEAYGECYDDSYTAHDAAQTAILVSTSSNLSETDLSHNVSITRHDTAVISHQDYLREAQEAIDALNAIKVATARGASYPGVPAYLLPFLRTRHTNVYRAIDADVDRAITSIRRNRDLHQSHITNMRTLQSKHRDLLTKVANLEVHEENFRNFEGGIYKWYETKTIIHRDDRTGTPISIADGRNVKHSTLFDSNSRFAVATVSDADISNSEAFYCGFENYENFDNYTVQTTIRTVGLRTYIDQFNGEIHREDAHTGSGALRFSRDNLKLYPASFNPNYMRTYADTAYVVSAFVKAPGSVRVWVGADTLSYAHAPSTAKNDQGNGGWQYIEGVVIGTNALVANKRPTLHVENAGSGVFIDDFMIRPLASELEATVYNNLSLPIAKIDRNGLTKRMYYDSHHRLQTVIDDKGRIYGLNLAAFSRDITAADSFVPATPNEATKFSFIDYGLLHKITSSNERRGSLTTGTPQAVINFSIKPDDADAMHLNFRVRGYSVDYHDGELHISHEGRDKIERLYSNIPEDWTFAELDDVLYLWVNGKRMDHYALPTNATTDMNLSWTLTSARMGDVIIGKKPVFKVDYTNGIGQMLQSVKPYFDDMGILRSSIYTASLYDGWGHKAITTLPINRIERDLGYRPNLITSFDWRSGVMQGEVSDYYRTNTRIVKHSSDHQYPYFRTFFENYPISRIAKSIKAGHEFHGSIDNSTLVQYQDASSNSLLIQFGLSSSDFNTKKTRSSLQHEKVTVKDKMGRKVISKKGDAISKSVNSYTTAGYGVDSLMSPNHFDTSLNRDGNSFTSSHAKEDMLNTISANQSPDRGRVEIIKDQLGRNVFIKTASSTATDSVAGDIKYYQYDELGRVISQGIYNSRWDKSRLNTLSKAKHWFDSDVKWVKAFQYDIDQAGSALYNKGRITRTLHNTDEALVQSDFVYNIYGQIVQNELTITDRHGIDVSHSRVAYEYYPSGQVKKITYPNGFEVVYTFNRTGKVKAIGTPDDLDFFATYQYDELDRLVSQTRDNQTYRSKVKYDFRGRQQITSWQASSDTIFKQELSFFNAGRYFDTKISRIKYSGSMYTNIQHDYTYDTQDRLSQTSTIMNQNTNLETTSTVNYRYDKNSNLLSYTNSAGPDLTMTYRRGTNQDRVANTGAYDSDGLKVRFESNIWGNHSKIAYNKFTNKPEAIFKTNFSQLNPGTYYKLSSLGFPNKAITVIPKEGTRAVPGEKLRYAELADTENQLFKFKRSRNPLFVDTGDTYNIVSASNENLHVHYKAQYDSLYLGPPSPNSNTTDLFRVYELRNRPGVYTISRVSRYPDSRRVIEVRSTSGGGYEVFCPPTNRTDRVNSRFILLKDRPAIPGKDFVWFNYDAKNNRVMKVRDLKLRDSTVKQDTLIYIHGNNRLPLTEFFYGKSVDANGNVTRVRNVSNYVYGPDFGSIGIRVFELDPQSTTDPFEVSDD